MTSPCIHCGLPEDEHHAFEARVMPAGCTCDAMSWDVPVVGTACAEFVPLAGEESYCKTCEHNAACHGEAKTP